MTSTRKCSSQAGLVAIIGALLAFASCGGGGSSNGTPSTLVNVSLQEFTITLDRASAPAGHVTFSAYNYGSEDHEFLVVRTDLAPDALPAQEDGSFDEEGAGVTVIEEIPEFPARQSRMLELDLAPGSYVLVCNRVEVEEGATVSHYHNGMRVAFTVG